MESKTITVWISDFEDFPQMSIKFATWISYGLIKIQKRCKHFVIVTDTGDPYFVERLYE